MLDVQTKSSSEVKWENISLESLSRCVISNPVPLHPSSLESILGTPSVEMVLSILPFKALLSSHRKFFLKFLKGLCHEIDRALVAMTDSSWRGQVQWLVTISFALCNNWTDSLRFFVKSTPRAYVYLLMFVNGSKSKRISLNRSK